MKTMTDDLRAEYTELAGLARTLAPAQWSVRSAFYGWTPWDEIAHLCFFDETALLAVSLADAARQVLGGWMAHKRKGEGEADQHACLEAIDHAARFGLEGFVHFEGDLPIAFLLAQELQPGVFAVRFAKGLDSHVGVYPYLFQHFCRQFGRPVQWLNFEQDMGLAGFRRSKRSYRPSALLPKWRVTLHD